MKVKLTDTIFFMGTEIELKHPPQLLSPNLISRTLRNQYGLNIKLLSPLEGGTESAAWTAETATGKWIAKVFSPNESREIIAEEIKLYRFLNSDSIHVPVIHPGKNKNQVGEIESNERRYPAIVMRFENLRRASPSAVTEAELKRVAGETAKMHQKLSGYPGKNEWPKVTTTDTALTNKKTPAFNAFIQSVNSEWFTEGQLEYFRTVDARMETFIRKFDTPNNLAYGPIHGDLALEHAQFLPDGSVYFFDFADRAIAPIAHELAVFLTWLYQWENISFDRWEQLKTWLLEGYRAETQLTPDDISSIPHFEIRRILGATYYLANLTKNIPSKHVVNWVRRGYELGDYLT